MVCLKPCTPSPSPQKNKMTPLALVNYYLIFNEYFPTIIVNTKSYYLYYLILRSKYIPFL